jgi:PAS domain S-box-containing protein
VTDRPDRGAPSLGSSATDLAQALFDQSPFSSVLYDANGRVIALNAAFTELWGARLEDVPPDYSVLNDPQLEKQGIIPAIRRAFAGEAVNTPPVRYAMSETAATGKGRTVWTEAHFHPIRDADGKVTHVVLTHIDITARMSAELALRDAVDAERAAREVAERTVGRLAALQRGTGELSGALTPADVAEVIIRSALPSLGATRFALALLDADRNGLEVVGAAGYSPVLLERYRFVPIETAFPLCDAVRDGAPIFLPSAAARAERYPHLADLRGENGAGSMAALPLRGNGAIIGALGFNWAEDRDAFSLEDIAFLDVLAQQCGQALERARLYEEERRARAEAEAANRAKGDFLAAMSHELRTPLNGIGGYVDLLDMGLRGPITDAQRADLDRIRRNQQHLLLLIEDVLSFARVEAGHLEVEDGPVAIDETLRSLEAMIFPQVALKRVRFLYQSCDSSLRARGDRDRIVQIGANLLANAIKATPAGGSIVLSAAADDEHVRIRVADTGVGIPQEMLTSVFEMFTQVGGAGHRGQGGLGIGLTLVRRLVELHGGRVWAESDGLKCGSTFVVRLPVAAADAAAQPPSSQERLDDAPSPAARRILVVDDNADAADTLAALLAVDGHDVRTASSGAAALALAPMFLPHVAFLDIGMPGMNGYELARRLRADPAAGGLLLVAVTGWGQAEDRRRAIEAGFDHHLTKPVDPKDVATLVARTARR